LENDNLKIDNFEITHSKLHMVSYGFGATINQFFQMAFSALGFYFYEVEIGLNVWLTSLGYIIFAIWNAINDPLSGYLTDRPFKFTQKWGRRFPWMLIGGIPWLFSYILIFFPPDVDPDSGALILFIWLVFTTCLFDTFNSLWWVNFYSLYPDKFRSARERRIAAGIITPVGILGVALGGIIPPLLISYGSKQTFLYQAFVVVMFNVVFFCLAIPGWRDDKVNVERYLKKYRESQKNQSFVEAIKLSLKHKNFRVYIILNIFFSAMGFCIQASIPYVVRYVLGASSSSQIILQIAFLTGSLVSTPLWIKFANKVNNNRKVLIFSTVMMIIFTFPLSFFTGLISLFITLFLWGFAYGGMWSLMRACIADVINESIVISGKRQEGVYNGIMQFFSRFALILQALTFAIIHGLTNFDEEAPIQSSEAIWGIQLHFGIIPMIYMIIGIAVFWKWYTLTPSKLNYCEIKIREMGL